MRLSDLGHRIIIRIPVIPGINDDAENLKQTGEFLASLTNNPPIELLPYHSIAEGKYTGLGMAYALPEIQSPSREELEEKSQILRSFGLLVNSKGKNPF